MTSRIHECSRYNPNGWLELQELPESQAVELLLKAARLSRNFTTTQELAAKETVTVVGGHTLGLIIAGLHIAEGLCNLEEFPRIYRQRTSHMLEFVPGQLRPRLKNIFHTFENSWRAIFTNPETQPRRGCDALALLCFLAKFSHRKLPISILEQACEASQHTRPIPEIARYPPRFPMTLAYHYAPWFPKLVEVCDNRSMDNFRLKEAAALLVGLALIKRDGEDEISMHTLTRDWLCERGAITERQIWNRIGAEIDARISHTPI